MQNWEVGTKHVALELVSEEPKLKRIQFESGYQDSGDVELLLRCECGEELTMWAGELPKKKRDWPRDCGKCGSGGEDPAQPFLQRRRPRLSTQDRKTPKLVMLRNGTWEALGELADRDFRGSVSAAIQAALDAVGVGDEG